jgi:uncharacterized protein (TIGR00725 family)
MKQKKNVVSKNHNHAHNLKYKICVSGAAETGHCGPTALKDAEEIGREIARQGLVLMTGATTGIPYWAAKGAKAEGGIVIGLSPASSKLQHVKTYRLPLDYHDLIIYTGFAYSGRNLLLTRASDAVVVLCGRIGTINEFTIAFEDKKPIGVLEGSWATDDVIMEILREGHRGMGKVIFSKKPVDLIDKVIESIEKEESKNGIKGRIL